MAKVNDDTLIAGIIGGAALLFVVDSIAKYKTSTSISQQHKKRDADYPLMGLLHHDIISNRFSIL